MIKRKHPPPSESRAMLAGQIAAFQEALVLVLRQEAVLRGVLAKLEKEFESTR